LALGKALAKAQVQKTLPLSRNEAQGQKDRRPLDFTRRYSFDGNALNPKSGKEKVKKR